MQSNLKSFVEIAKPLPLAMVLDIILNLLNRFVVNVTCHHHQSDNFKAFNADQMV